MTQPPHRYGVDSRKPAGLCGLSRWRPGSRAQPPGSGELIFRSLWYHVAVTLAHWDFARFAGACCLLFIAMPSPYKPLVPFITAIPQLLWVWFAVHRARAVGLRRWVTRP